MVAYSLMILGAVLAAAQSADPSWLNGSPDITEGLQQADAMSQSMGGFGWTMPVGVGLLLLLKLAPNLGTILQNEHQLSIEKRRQLLAQKGEPDAKETREGS